MAYHDNMHQYSVGKVPLVTKHHGLGLWRFMPLSSNKTEILLSGFLRFPPPIKTDLHDIAEIL
jgi:hypothetical protein